MTPEREAMTLDSIIAAAAKACSKHAYGYWRGGSAGSFEARSYYDEGLPNKEAHEAPYADVIRRAVNDAIDAHLSHAAEPVAWPTRRANVPYPNGLDGPDARLVGFVIAPDHPWYGTGLSSPLFALEKALAATHPPEPARDAELPREAPLGLLVSMAIRFDHGLGVPGYYDAPIFGVEGVGHAKRLRATISTMRQLYEEVSGHGFYSPAKEASYAAMAQESSDGD